MSLSEEMQELQELRDDIRTRREARDSALQAEFECLKQELAMQNRARQARLALLTRCEEEDAVPAPAAPPGSYWQLDCFVVLVCGLIALWCCCK